MCYMYPSFQFIYRQEIIRKDQWLSSACSFQFKPLPNSSVNSLTYDVINMYILMKENWEYKQELTIPSPSPSKQRIISANSSSVHIKSCANAIFCKSLTVMPPFPDSASKQCSLSTL